jgi:hypothetical protein
MGDVSSLIREDRHLRQALRNAYGSLDGDDSDDVPPEPETEALFQQIRVELDSRMVLAPRPDVG